MGNDCNMFVKLEVVAYLELTQLIQQWRSCRYFCFLGIQATVLWAHMGNALYL